MPDGWAATGLAVLSAFMGFLASVITNAFKAGARNEALATKKDLQYYVRLDTFNALKDDLKNDLDEIKNRQSASELLQEKRHDQVIDILIKDKK